VHGHTETTPSATRPGTCTGDFSNSKRTGPLPAAFARSPKSFCCLPKTANGGRRCPLLLSQQTRSTISKIKVMKTLTTLIAALVISSFSLKASADDKKKVVVKAVPDSAAAEVMCGSAEPLEVTRQFAAPEFVWGNAEEKVEIVKRLVPEFSFGSPEADTRAIKGLPAKPVKAPAFEYGDPNEEVKI
jgi:hypothetical protein